MGWDMFLYVIDEGVGHDPLKVCKQLDYEPDEADKPDMDQKIDNNSHETVCPKCLWYLARYKENPGYVKDKMHIGHSYSNPILDAYDWSLRGKWSIVGDRVDQDEYLVIGQMYAWTLRDVLTAESSLLALREPRRNNHKEAREETLSTLKWAREWLEKSPHYKIITTSD